MTTPLKPLTENKVTAEIPSEAAAFRGWAIGAHKLVLINIRELADRQDEVLRRMLRYEKHQERQQRSIGSVLKKWARLTKRGDKK